MTTSDSIPQIVCSKCHLSLPATLEFFYKKKRGKHGLYSFCKKCHVAMTTPRAKAWNEEHPDRVRQNQKTYYATYRDVLSRKKRDPEKSREKARRDYLANPEKYKAKQRRRDARKRNLPSTFTTAQWQVCLEYFHLTCAYCGAQQSFWHVLEQEHFIPVSAGGGYTADNIVPACKSCNMKKYNSNPIEWLSRNFKPSQVKQILARIQQYFEWIKEQDQ